MNQCIRLAESLIKFSNTRPVSEVKQAMVGIVSVWGNIRMVHFLYFLKDKHFTLIIFCIEFFPR
jgi:hypothetical protein